MGGVMKLKFKVQPYQTNAVASVVDCFTGQPLLKSTIYRIDPGKSLQVAAYDEGFKNADIRLSDAQILNNLQEVQKRQNLSVSSALVETSGCKVNLDIEMETGTGKTYCYIKTIFELNKTYGWSKFIIMVPSVAIREGVQKSLAVTAEHFNELYSKKARFFTYNSKRLHELESFSSDAGINVMVINIQAFAAQGADNRRIYDELDDFQSRRPIDVIAKNNPILILDEPQKMEGPASKKALSRFNPLMILRYSATHKTIHNKVHRLDALDAYNQKLVKKIAVRGVQVRGLAGSSAYLYLENITVSKMEPTARIELDIKMSSGAIKRLVRRVKVGDDLKVLAGGLEAYHSYKISQIDARFDTIEFTNGITLKAGDALGDVSAEQLRRIQIRESIKAHLDKEKQLYAQGIKVLSLFFIDEVSKYRDYDCVDTKGDYAQIFEHEYELLRTEYIAALTESEAGYRDFLMRDSAEKVHEGYFAIDKQRRLIDPSISKTGQDKGFSNDVSAYELILKNKERLLSQKEPVRFIFSHSALREGWDNPNVFVICMLKHSDSEISRRQEVGRGLRLAVNEFGERMDHPAIVHDINVLTVISSESYKEFVDGLQKEISGSLASRPRQANEAFFKGKLMITDFGTVEVGQDLAAGIEFYLVQQGYVDRHKHITDTYHQAKLEGTLAELPADLREFAPQVFELIDSVFSEASLPIPEDGRRSKTNPLNSNFDKKEFKDLWSRINKKAVYKVAFDSSELIEKCISSLDSELHVTPLQYTVKIGKQVHELTPEALKRGEGFELDGSHTAQGQPIETHIRYDLLGKITENVDLTRGTVAEILSRIQPSAFQQYANNPEQFISECSRIIKEQKATVIIEQLTYDTINDCHDVSIFTTAQTGNDFSRATEILKKHIFDYAMIDSDIERQFVSELDTSNDVVVYAKLPRGFLIPTPVGDYNPDWAIAFVEGQYKHIYFVAETKGTLSSMKLRPAEKTKIDCARKFFKAIDKDESPNNVRYEMVDSYSALVDLIATR